MSLTSEEARALQAQRPAKFSQEDIETGLMAMIAWAGNATAAARWLKAEDKFEVTPQTLTKWKTTHAARYDELREKYAGQMEASLAHEFRDIAMQATQLEKLAMEKAIERLEAGKEDDPARVAANAARVAQSSTDKLMTITARPTQIVETRNTEEIVRSLVAKGILAVPDAPAELSESSGPATPERPGP